MVLLNAHGPNINIWGDKSPHLVFICQEMPKFMGSGIVVAAIRFHYGDTRRVWGIFMGSASRDTSVRSDSKSSAKRVECQVGEIEVGYEKESQGFRRARRKCLS